jgi:hypothetical protein
MEFASIHRRSRGGKRLSAGRVNEELRRVQAANGATSLRVWSLPPGVDEDLLLFALLHALEVGMGYLDSVKERALCAALRHPHCLIQFLTIRGGVRNEEQLALAFRENKSVHSVSSVTGRLARVFVNSTTISDVGFYSPDEDLRDEDLCAVLAMPSVRTVVCGVCDTPRDMSAVILREWPGCGHSHGVYKRNASDED